MSRKIPIGRNHPKVGIFWFIPISSIGEVPITFFEEARKVKPVGGFRDSDLAHYEKWPEVAKEYKLSGEYFDYPRGRVLYLETKKQFVIYSSTELVSDRGKMLNIMRCFSLPIRQTKAISDFHYELNPEWDGDD